MGNKIKLLDKSSNVKKYTLILAILWTVSISTSFTWNYINGKNGAIQTVKEAARSQFFIDLLYRRWNASHGGIYVPVTKNTKPNPYLTFIDKRDITTKTGLNFTLMNPAYMTRQVHELGLKSRSVLGHITSLKPIRPANAADFWEKIALKSFENGEKEYSSIQKINNIDHLRLMRPLKTEKGCLKCHAQQGYTIGDIRGGISVSIPMTAYLSIANKQIVLIGVGHIIFWLLGLLGLIIGTHHINHQFYKNKLGEKEKEKLKIQLQQAQKMEAIGTLAGGIAHDFNNILGIIMGYTEMNLDDTIDTKSNISNLKRIMKASERAKDMVDQILAFSRKSEQTMRSVDIGKVIKETIAFLRSSIPTTINIKYNIDKNPGLIFGDATQINQVLMNLCTNAAHAMKEEGGLLEISLKEVVLDKNSSIITDLKSGTYKQLTVSDTGSGMSKEIIERIFEPYFTTKQVNEGTGMGLAVIYGIIKSHKGDIKVFSEPGKGTVFNVYFPVLEISKTKDLENDQKPAVMGNNEKILFVDDEIILAELGSKMLKNLGYIVESRTNSVEALEAFKADSKKYDLIITDMTMPNMTGVKLAGEIHKINPEIPIVICTGFSSSINKDNFKNMGISALIMKPVVKSELAETIRRVLNKL